MSNLERRIRDVLEDEARGAPGPHEPTTSLRRTRRRQVAVVVGGAVGTLVLVAASLAGVSLMSRDGPRDELPAAVTSTTVNGISISHPADWFVVEPDDAGLNSTPADVQGLPRLVLALSPNEIDELFACPGLVEADPPTFLMTVQEQALALSGQAAAPWPVEPRLLDVMDESGCYPGWALFGNEWTIGGRTFQARIGFAPGVADEDRRALLDAFAGMTFEPTTEPATSVVLATGTAGGEEWELIAERQADELMLSIQGESFGTGGGGWDPTRLTANGHVFGTGDDAELLLYGAVPRNVARIGVRIDPDDEGLVDVLDVPDTIDPNLNAFVATVTGHPEVTLHAYDANGDVVDTVIFRNDDHEPVGTPPPTLPPEVVPEHGGTFWGLYLAAAPSTDDPEIARWTERMETIGYTPSVGDLACDDGAADALGIDPGWSRVAIYFDTREEAETAAGTIEISLELGTPIGVARVTTFCLD